MHDMNQVFEGEFLRGWGMHERSPKTRRESIAANSLAEDPTKAINTSLDSVFHTIIRNITKLFIYRIIT